MVTFPKPPASARCSLMVLGAGEAWAAEADVVHRTASIGKIFLLIEVAAQLEAGTLSSETVLEWRDDELVADSGLWHRLSVRGLPIGDLCLLTGAVSDNLATNVLVRHVGIEAVRRRAIAVGCQQSALLDRVRDHRGSGDAPTLSVGTAGELAALMMALHRGEVVSPAVSRQVLDWLASNADLSMVASAFRLDPLAHADDDRGLRLWNKTGTISTARCDVGVLAGPAGIRAWAALANWDDDADARDEVLDWMAAVGRVILAEVSVRADPPRAGVHG